MTNLSLVTNNETPVDPNSADAIRARGAAIAAVYAPVTTVETVLAARAADDFGEGFGPYTAPVKSARAARAVAENGGLKGYTTRWNNLVSEAHRLGITSGVKIHTSDFESYTKAEKRIRWLESQIEAKKTGAPVNVETDPLRRGSTSVTVSGYPAVAPDSGAVARAISFLRASVKA